MDTLDLNSPQMNLDRSYHFFNPCFDGRTIETLKAATIQHETDSMIARSAISKPLVWLLSSGTSATDTHSFKLMALSHQALLASASAVNEHLEVTSNDRWLNVLPMFHVGGLSILYRAQAANVEVMNGWTPHFKWSTEHLLSLCRWCKPTLLSLVPTQIHDLVRSQTPAPSSLRVVLVGGGALSFELFEKARQLGWPLVPSFGMTEASSQIATGPLFYQQISKDWPRLKILNHIQTKVDESQRLFISGPSLFEGYYPIATGHRQKWVPSLIEGWYATQDRVEITNRYLYLLSRMDEVVKILGENVNLARLRRIASELESTRICAPVTLITLPDSRRGVELVLVGEGDSSEVTSFVHDFNTRVLPFEQIQRSFCDIIFPRTALGKIQYSQLFDMILSKK